MTYATAQSLVDRFDAEELAQRADRGIPRLVTAAMLKVAAAGGSIAGYTAPEQAAITAALAVMNKALADADDTVNGYLQSRYAVPLVPAPNLIVRHACDLARYFLYDDQVTEVITQRFKDAKAYLMQVAEGKVALGTDAANVPVQGVDLPQFSSTPHVFGRGEDGSFI